MDKSDSDSEMDPFISSDEDEGELENEIVLEDDCWVSC